jgi:ATP-dependent helicase/nuclease subunit A
MPAFHAALNGAGQGVMMSLDIANTEQRAASDPAVSAFVAASAGSGKTKLLTDRLLRLMLAGVDPARILCLTYTKAAAAEMAIRLNRRLGNWVVLPEAALDSELAALDVPVTPKNRDLARKLFADVLDLPGGMRIATIHAFCQSLLRRFPLEAELSPHFELADDADAHARLRESRETILADPDHRDAIAALAAETNEQDFAALTAKFAAGQHDLRALLHDYGADGITAMQRAALAAPEHEHDALLRAAVQWEREWHLAQSLRRVAEAGNPSGRKWAFERLDWLAHHAEDRFSKWVHWVAGHFTSAGTPRKLDNFFGKGLAFEREALNLEITAEHERIARIEEHRKAAKLCALNSNLTQLLAPILAADDTSKTATAVLSYADLITRTAKLLVDPGAAWILYKLDGGIDHLLLDEVQDTAPMQWNIADAIAQEFFAGQGARDQPRSIFAVGDPKQSIFSFQGADLQSFETYRARFRNKVKDSGNAWLDGKLSVSFRSTAPVLALVDAVFADGPAQAGVVQTGATLQHGVSRDGQAGSVTLWPLTEPGEAPPLPPWAVPETYGAADSAKAILARSIALHIQERLADQDLLPSRNRPIAPGDVLILVRQRDELVTAITRACKSAGIPIAGLDRMVLTAQPAVADMMALCDALLLPEDDLAFGQFLASPLGGLTDEALMHLAIDRRSTLAAALYAQRETFAEAHGFFEALRQKVDYTTPHALLAEALGPLGGRAKLLARLGPEAAEPLDELLAEAQAFSRREPGALQTFLHHLRTAGAEIKREADAGGDVVRIMTVHGAKGLQAPVVILPDSTSLPKDSETLFWLHPPQAPPDIAVPVFCPRKDLRSAAVNDALNERKAASQEEYNRLLYVALTRAEDEVIICGAAPKKALPETCWYKSVEAGFARLAATESDGVLTYVAPQTAPPDRAGARAAATTATLPAWAGAAPGWIAAPPPAETTRPEPLAPSRNTEDAAQRAAAASPLGNMAALAGARAAALAKGRAVHALLQHLPDLPPAARAPAAATFLARVPELNPAAGAEITAAVLAILDHPELKPLFGPGSRAEVPLAGVVGDVEIGGLVDRLAVTPARILLADYKTDRAPPAAPEAIPPAYLGQLAAYRAILAQIFPDRAIDCLLIFTANACAISVPPALLARHAPAAATAA